LMNCLIFLFISMVVFQPVMCCGSGTAAPNPTPPSTTAAPKTTPPSTNTAPKTTPVIDYTLPTCVYELQTSFGTLVIDNRLMCWANYTDSARICYTRYNGVLAPINTQERMNEVAPLFHDCFDENRGIIYQRSDGFYWIGLTTTDGWGYWTDGIPYSTEEHGNLFRDGRRPEQRPSAGQHTTFIRKYGDEGCKLKAGKWIDKTRLLCLRRPEITTETAPTTAAVKTRMLKCINEFQTSFGTLVVIDERMNTTESARVCKTRYHGILAPINTRERIDEVAPLLHDCIDEEGHYYRNRYYYIGLTTNDGVGNWTDGTPYSEQQHKGLYYNLFQPKQSGCYETYLYVKRLRIRMLYFACDNKQLTAQVSLCLRLPTTETTPTTTDEITTSIEE